MVDDDSVLGKFKSAFSVDGEEMTEEDIRELKQDYERLQKKYRAKRMQQEIAQMKGEDGGKLSKIKGVFEDLGKSQGRALSILVGPPEAAESTERFVIGPTTAAEPDSSIDSFLLGSNGGEPEDIGIDFPHNAGKPEDGGESLEKIMEENYSIKF